MVPHFVQWLYEAWAQCRLCGHTQIVRYQLCQTCFQQLPLCGDEGYFSIEATLLYQAEQVMPRLEVISSFHHIGLVQKMIIDLKYHNGLWAIPVLAEALADRLRPNLCKRAILVPVPLHHRRIYHRGYNQAALIAEWLSRQLDCNLVNNLLIRQHQTQPQQDLSRQARSKNVQDCFRAAITDRPVILVDDVMTTGATLLSARQSLIRAGCVQVSAAVVSIAN